MRKRGASVAAWFYRITVDSEMSGIEHMLSQYRAVVSHPYFLNSFLSRHP